VEHEKEHRYGETREYVDERREERDWGNHSAQDIQEGEDEG
jgi:hypothetical protein